MLNRATRRKASMKIVNDAMKGRAAHDKAVAEARAKALVKKQWGVGLVWTNLMLTIMVGPWAFSLYDRRAR